MKLIVASPHEEKKRKKKEEKDSRSRREFILLDGTLLFSLGSGEWWNLLLLV